MYIKPKKKLGQNFLSDPKIISKIAKAAEITKGDTVIEIGPGKGSLTKELLSRAKKVIAIEKDELLAKELEVKFNKEIKDNKLQIIVGDVINLEKSSANEPCETGQSQATQKFFNRKMSLRENRSLFPDNYKLVGNIPYYITGEIFRKFLESNNQPDSITFVIQKEVAEKIARSKKGNILSISIKAYGEPKYIATIKSGSFFPKPKVDSAILTIKNIGKNRFFENNVEESRFFKIVRLGFAHKRKLLIRNLSNHASSKTNFNIEKLDNIFDKLGINKKARAEDIRLEDWFKITKNI